MSLIDQYYPKDEDEDEEEKKKRITPSQVAGIEQKKKGSLIDTYYPAKEEKEPEPEPEKPKVIERVKGFFRGVADFALGKKKVKDRASFEEEFGIVPESVPDEPHSYFDYHAFSTLPVLQKRVNEIDVKQDQELAQGKFVSGKLQKEKDRLNELIGLDNNSLKTVLKRTNEVNKIYKSRTRRGVVAGAVDVADSFADAVSWLGRDIEGVEKTARKTSDKIEQWSDFIRPEQPEFADQLAQGIGSALTFFAPGVGVAKGATFLARVSPAIALFFGNVASTTLESASEAGSVYDESIKAGKSKDEASKQASKTFWANSVLIGLTNRFGIFGKSAARLKKVLASAGLEGLQEYAQQVISNVNTGKPWDEGTIESGIIGSIIGGGMGSIDITEGQAAAIAPEPEAEVIRKPIEPPAVPPVEVVEAKPKGEIKKGDRVKFTWKDVPDVTGKIIAIEGASARIEVEGTIISNFKPLGKVALQNLVDLEKIEKPPVTKEPAKKVEGIRDELQPLAKKAQEAKSIEVFKKQLREGIIISDEALPSSLRNARRNIDRSRKLGSSQEIEKAREGLQEELTRFNKLLREETPFLYTLTKNDKVQVSGIEVADIPTGIYESAILGKKISEIKPKDIPSMIKKLKEKSTLPNKSMSATVAKEKINLLREIQQGTKPIQDFYTQATKEAKPPVEKPTEGEYRVTPTGQETVPEIVKVGDIVYSSYSDIRYRVESINEQDTHYDAPEGRSVSAPPSHGLVLSDIDAKRTKGGNLPKNYSYSYINELVAVDGRLLKLFQANADEVFVEGKEKKPKEPVTQKQKVKEAVKEEAKTVKEIAKETKILEPNVRRIVGVGAKEGTFERVDRGVYILSTKEQGDIAYVHTGDALKTLPKLAKEGLKADMVFLDIPYKTPAVTGGNRGIKYLTISPDQFRTVVKAVSEITKNKDTPIYYMYSKAKSGLQKMLQYNKVLTEEGFKPIAEGNYRKYQKDGITRVRNMRGDVIKPEGIILLNKSGKFVEKDAKRNLEFDIVRPKGYQTEKPALMMDALVLQGTKIGDTILDPFAGSGVAIAEAVKLGRKAVGIEISKEVVEKHIKPKLKKIEIRKVKKPKLRVFVASAKKKLQQQVKEVVISGKTQEEAVKNVDKFLANTFNQADDPLYGRKLKTIRAELKRSMYEMVGAITGNWKRDYAYFHRLRENPDYKDLVDRMEDGIFQIDDIVSKTAPSSMGLATTGSKPVGEFEKRTEPRKGTDEFKLFEKTKELTRKYAKIIGEGYTPRNALGVYYPKTKNIFVNALNNLSVVSHEITHFLDKTYKISDKLLALKGFAVNGNPIYDPATMKYRRAITDLYTKYYAGGKKTHKLRKRALEGFATLLQKYVESPQRITKEYPLLVNNFLKKGGQYYHPVMGEIIKDLNEIVKEYQGLSALDKVGSRVVTGEAKVDKSSFLNFRDRLRTFIADELYPIEVLAKKSKRHFVKADPSLWLRAYNNVSGIVNHNINSKRGYWTFVKGNIKKTHNFNWKTLHDSLETGKNTDDFNYYLTARREHFSYKELDVLKEEFLQEVENLKATPKDQRTTKDQDGLSPLDRAKAAKVKYQELKELLDRDGFSRGEVDSAYLENKDRFTKEEKMFDTLTKEDLKFLSDEDVQLITPNQYQELTSKQGYASFKRQFYNEVVGENNEIPIQTRVGKNRVSSLLRRRGSQQAIISPLTSAITNHSEIMRKGLRQVVYNKITDIGTSAAFPNIFQDLQLKVSVDPKTGALFYPQEKDPNIVMGRLDYKRKPVLVDAEIKNVLDNVLTYRNVDTFARLYTGLSRLFTAGTTGYYPPFAVVNLLRDQITAQANTVNRYKTLYSPIKDFGKALLDRNSEEYGFYEEYLVMGGERQTFTGWQKLPPDKLAQRIRDEKNGIKKTIRLMEKGTNILSAPAKYSELVTRATEYINARRAGKSTIVALEEAGRLTAPFHHLGSWGGKYGQIFIRGIPYFNASLQVLDQHARVAATPDGKKRMLVVLAAITSAYIASMMALLDAEDEQKEQYKDLKPEELARYLYFPHPSGKNLIRLPMSEVFTPAGTIINMIIADELLKAKYTQSDYIHAATAILPDQFDPSEPTRAFLSWIPQIFKTGTEAVVGVKTYPEVTPLESMAVKNLPPGLRTKRNTSDFAKWLGERHCKCAYEWYFST